MPLMTAQDINRDSSFSGFTALMEHFLKGIASLRHFNATIFFNRTLNLRTDMQKSYVYPVLLWVLWDFLFIFYHIIVLLMICLFFKTLDTIALLDDGDNYNYY